jgi:hypothetical protein
MFGWLRRKPAAPVEFTDNQEAFAYACRELDNRVLINAVIPALVEEEGRRGSEGEHFFLLRLAGREGGRRLWAPTLKEVRTFPEVGDLVGFRVVTIASDLPADANVIGYIAFGLAPGYVPGQGWRIAVNFTPPNLKPELHL